MEMVHIIPAQDGTSGFCLEERPIKQGVILINYILPRPSRSLVLHRLNARTTQAGHRHHHADMHAALRTPLERFSNTAHRSERLRTRPSLFHMSRNPDLRSFTPSRPSRVIPQVPLVDMGIGPFRDRRNPFPMSISGTCGIPPRRPRRMWSRKSRLRNSTSKTESRVIP